MWSMNYCFWAGLLLAGAALTGCDGGDTPVSPAPPVAARGAASDFAAAGAAGPSDADGAAGDDLELDSGRQLFMSTCSACHGATAQGMPNQGPGLRASPMVSRSSDAELVAFVTRG